MKAIKVGTGSENMHTFIWKENDQGQRASKTGMMLQTRYEFNNVICIQYHVHAFHVNFGTKSNVKPL